MSRAVPLLLAAACVAVALLLPGVSRARLAVLQAHELLGEEVSVQSTTPGRMGTMPMWEAVLTGPAARSLPGGGTELRLYGVRLAADPSAGADIAMNLGLRRSIVRGLRQFAPQEHQPLTIVGEVAPRQDEGGANFYLQLIGESLDLQYTVHKNDEEGVAHVEWQPPSKKAVWPPLIAVALAILFRKPLLALFMGVLSGAVLVESAAGGGFATSLTGGFVEVVRWWPKGEAFSSFASWWPSGWSPDPAIHGYFFHELYTKDRAMIVGFVFFMLAMVGVMTRSGGIRGLMGAVAKHASNAKRTQLGTYGMGLAIFFDDYANTILVGSTMRPLTDRYQASRARSSRTSSTARRHRSLDSRSSALGSRSRSPRSTRQLARRGHARRTMGYEVFLQHDSVQLLLLPHDLAFVGLLALGANRDFGPMLTAERRARLHGSQLLRPGCQRRSCRKRCDVHGGSGRRSNPECVARGPSALRRSWAGRCSIILHVRRRCSRWMRGRRPSPSKA